MRKFLIWLLCFLIIFIKFFVELPPLNVTSPVFWEFFVFVCIVLFIGLIFTRSNPIPKIKNKDWSFLYKYKVIIGCIIFIVAAIIIVNVIHSPLFNAKSYARRITIDETHDFVTDVKPVDFTKTPLIDKESSQKLGDRKMGEFKDWVSQFYVSDLYTQINYNNNIVRVTPIEYMNFIKYLTNRGEGIKGFIQVDSVDGKAKLIKLDKGMKYMPSAYLFEDLMRVARFKYPTAIFDDPSFEVDNEGHPYWIIPTVKYKGVGLKKDINGAVILDPITGKSKRYKVKDIPSWVDHVYSPDTIIEQVNHWGEYKKGFFNSIFGQKEVVNTTEGYNYLVMDDDVYLYTGITSVATDESNLGFVLVNMRTKKTNFYQVSGAEEFSAMSSAEGLVQEKGYDASFPLLINLDNKPTYLLSLKDNAGLVKMYALIDVTDYQKVVVNEASQGILATVEKYLGDSYVDGELKEKKITVKTITSAVIDGTTHYYIEDNEGDYYTCSIKVSKSKLPFVKAGDTLDISYKEKTTNQIVKIK